MNSDIAARIMEGDKPLTRSNLFALGAANIRLLECLDIPEARIDTHIWTPRGELMRCDTTLTGEVHDLTKARLLAAMGDPDTVERMPFGRDRIYQYATWYDNGRRTSLTANMWERIK